MNFVFHCREPRCWQGCDCCSLLLSLPHRSPRASFCIHRRRERSRRELISWDCTKLNPSVVTSCPHPLARLGADPCPALCTLPWAGSRQKTPIFTLFFPCSSLLRETPGPINIFSRTAFSCSPCKAQLLFPVLSHPPSPVIEALSHPSPVNDGVLHLSLQGQAGLGFAVTGAAAFAFCVCLQAGCPGEFPEAPSVLP